MPVTSSLVAKLTQDYPRFSFSTGEKSHWSASQLTIFYNPDEPHVDWILLHELSHACLEHAGYSRDIILLQMEREAWEYARNTLAPRYNVTIDTEFIEDHLDTYRDWIHTKSTCPKCTLTGMEVTKHRYRCLNCHHQWNTNTGTQVRIQRYSTNTKTPR